MLILRIQKISPRILDIMYLTIIIVEIRVILHAYSTESLRADINAVT